MDHTADTSRVAHNYIDSLEQRDWERLTELLAENVVYEMPQTRERIRGRSAFLQFNREYPGDWHLRVRRVVAEGSHAAVWVDVRVGDKHQDACVWLDVSEPGRISRVTDYWPEAYDPPAGREHLVEQYCGAMTGTEPTIRSVNPADLSDIVTELPAADAAAFVMAARAARAAQRDWAKVPAPVRGQVVANLGRLVRDNAETLAQLVTREVGKPIKEARGEVQEIVDTCDFFLGEGRRLYGQTVPSEMPDKQLFTFRVPVGVAAIITAGNFPVAVPSWYLIPALLCGNAVIWKPAEYAAASGNAFAELVRRAGVPDGVFDVVHASGEATFAGLSQALADRLVDKVGFTGSPEVGARIGELCGRHLQSPCLELGGKNPMVVTANADLDLAVEAALFSGFGTAGQRCTSLGTAIVHRSVYEQFLTRLDAAVRGAAVGDPTRTDVVYGPLLSDRFAQRYEQFLGWIEGHHRVLGSGGRTGRITGQNPRDGFLGDPEQGLFYHPVVVADVRADDDLFGTETFGPIVGAMAYRDLDEAIDLANAPGYGLSSAIYTTDPAEAFAFRAGISAGMVSVNNSTSGAEAHLPFGGNGKSGNGSRQSGQWVLDQFTRWQSMNWDYSGRLQKAQMDTLSITPDLAFRLQ